MEEQFEMSDELYHHGIKGQKWGVRRTPAQLGHVVSRGAKKVKSMVRKSQAKRKAKKAAEEKEKREEAKKKKPVSKMTDKELQTRINRLNMERQALSLQRDISNLQPQHVSAGKKFIRSVGRDVLAPAAKNVGRQYLEKALKDKLGLNTTDAYAEMQKAVKNHNIKKSYDKMQEEIRNEKSKTNKSSGGEKRQSESSSKQKSSEQKSSKESSKKAYHGTVEGEGKSHFTWSKQEGPTVNGEFRDVSSSSSQVKQRASIGQNYVTMLLEDKQRRR